MRAKIKREEEKKHCGVKVLKFMYHEKLSTFIIQR